MKTPGSACKPRTRRSSQSKPAEREEGLTYMLSPTHKSSTVLEIERLGFAWSEEAQYDLDLIDQNERVQVRDSDHYAPKAQVAQYAVQMGQTPFPPIVVSRNNWLIDGNTRKEARRIRKEKYTAAIIVDADFGKSAKVDARLHALAATLNQTGGQRLTPQEAKAAAKKMLAGGETWKPEQISRAVGIKTSAVAQVKRELAAEAKFAKVGFAHGDKLPRSVVNTLGSADVTVLNDVPFKKLTDLALDANLAPKEVNDLAKAMKATGSDAGMISHIDAKRAEMVDRIKEHALFGNGKPAPSSMLRRALGSVTKYAATPSALVEHSPAAMAEHLKVIEAAIVTLQAVAKLQEEVIDG